MLGQATTKTAALILILASLCLTALLSQFRGTNLFGQLSAYEENTANTIAISSRTIDHDYITPVRVSVKQNNIFSDLFSPTVVYVDMGMSASTTNMVMIDHAYACYPFRQDGTRLPFSENDANFELKVDPGAIGLRLQGDAAQSVTFTSNDVMNINQMGSSHVWQLELRPYDYGYWVRCELHLEPGALNYSFTGRRLNFLNLYPEDMMLRVRKFRHLDDPAMEGFLLQPYIEKMNRFRNPEMNRDFPRRIRVQSDVENARSVDIDDGSLPFDPGSDVNQNPKTTFEWDDSRFEQAENILYLVIPGLFGFGVALFLRKKPLARGRVSDGRMH